MRTTHRPVYMSTMLPGLEHVAMDEIQAKISDASITDIQRGKVFFSSGHPPETVTMLRSVDNLFLFLGKFPVGPHKVHLKQLEQTIESIDLADMPGYDGMHSGNASFVVNSSRSGKHAYSRFDLARAAGLGLARRHPNWVQGTADRHELEFRLDVTHDQAVFCSRLTPPDFRFRGRQRMFSPAALRPSVAHALVWVAKPRDDEVFLDPFCGSGTIVAERAHYPFGRLFGSDISPEALEAARHNLPEREHLSLHSWDARDLPLEAGSVDTVISNLPFGEQILSFNDISYLYLKFMKQLKRILKPDGQAFLMTDKTTELQKVAHKFGLACFIELELSLKGLHPVLFTIQR